jgi:hypothetical protein
VYNIATSVPAITSVFLEGEKKKENNSVFMLG